MQLTEEIKAELDRQGISQIALAERIGLSRQGLSKKLNNHTDFTYSEVSRVAEALGLTHADLVARTEAAGIDATALAGASKEVA